jgi:hypothetical protein
MKVLVDENIPRMTVTGLRELGHDVKDIRGTVHAERRLLITSDKGFTEYRGGAHYGILIIRLRQPNRLKIHQSVMRPSSGSKSWSGPACS